MENFAMFFLGIFIGICAGIAVARFSVPEGTRTEIVEYLQEQPNVCRTITTFTDAYKEKTNE